MEINSIVDHIKVLFVPVSAAKGSGEYQRSLLIANELKSLYGDNVEIQFVISKHASYVDNVPFKVYKLDSSATNRPKELHKILDEYIPNLVIFDCAGRVKSYRYAKKLGCKVALIVSRPKKRKRAISLRVARYLDLVIVTSHLSSLNQLSWRERAVKSIYKPLDITLVNALFQTPEQNELVLNTELPKDYCFLFLTGGQFIFDNVDAPKLTKEAAKAIAKESNLPCIIIDPKVERVVNLNSVYSLPMQDNSQFISLISNAKICVVGTGDVAAQVLALDKPVVMVATSKTGHKYLADYIQLGVTQSAAMCPEDIAAKVITLNNKEEKEQQSKHRKQTQFSNGLIDVIKAITHLVNEK